MPRRKQHLSIVRHFLPDAWSIPRRRSAPFRQSEMAGFYADKYIAVEEIQGAFCYLTLVRLETGMVLLTVDGDGPGIPEDLLSRVFEPFFRVAPGRAQPIPGAGLGLAIAREIIERFGGSITLANRPQGGLRQVVTFPLLD